MTGLGWHKWVVEQRENPSFLGRALVSFFPFAVFCVSKRIICWFFLKIICFSLHRIYYFFFLKKLFIFHWRIIASWYGVGLCRMSAWINFLKLKCSWFTILCLFEVYSVGIQIFCRLHSIVGYYKTLAMCTLILSGPLLPDDPVWQHIVHTC